MDVYQYQVGGSLDTDAPSYVVRKADTEIYTALKRGEFCYVLNCRQMGKSSILVRTLHRLQQEGYKCTTVDMTRIGSERITPEQWYKGVVADLWRGFGLLGKFNLKAWWREEEDVSLLQQLSDFIEDVLLAKFPAQKIVIFIDEIDSILGLDFPVDDFFAFIRFCYNQRAINPEYNRLTFAIFGVATPSDLIADKKRTPFNIGRAIELQGFELQEAHPLSLGLAGKVSNTQAILKEILAWTSGQPFLTQKLCQLLLKLVSVRENETEETPGFLSVPPGTEAFWVESVVRKHIIDKWELQDEPEHLKTISDRILRNEQFASRLLGIYQQILQGVEVPADDSREQIELLLSGLLVKQEGFLRVKNRIYKKVFNLEWVEKHLGKLRPYSQLLDAWVNSNKQDFSRLLRGKALKDAQLWAQGKSLSDLDYKFLAASQELDRLEVQQALEAARLREVEARLREEQKRRAQEKRAAKLQKFFLGAVSVGLIIAIALGMSTLAESRRATRSEIKAIATSSDALFISHQSLDALIAALKANQKLQQLGKVDADTENYVEKILRQAVYGVVESNRLSGHQDAVLDIAFSLDGNLIASSSGDNSIKLWKKDGTLLRTLNGHRSAVYSIAFSPDGQTLASCSSDKTIKLWKIDGTELATLKGHSSPVRGIAFSPDGRSLASASEDNTVKLWNLKPEKNYASIQNLIAFQGHTNYVYAIAFSPDGKTLASGSWDGTVKLWNIDGTLLQTFKGHKGAIWSVAFSPQGNVIASAGEDKRVRLWKIDGTLLATLEGHSNFIRSVAFSPDGNTLASASEDKTVKLWRIDGTLLTTIEGHSDGLWSAVFSPDGSIVAAGGWDNIIKFWKRKDTLLTLLEGHSDGVWRVAFSPDGNTIATASRDKTVKLWKRDGTLLTTLKGHNDVVWKVAFAPNTGHVNNPDAPMLASTGRDKTIKLWKADGTLLRTLNGHTNAVGGIAFSPDGQMLVSGGYDNTIKLWKIDGTLLKTIKGHDSEVWEVAFSPDGQMLVSAGNDKTLKLWKLDGTLLRTFTGHNQRVGSVTFSPNGHLLASGSWDGTIKLWKLDGTAIATLNGHRGAVHQVAFSPDGNKIASASADKTIKLWNIDGTELTTLYRHSAGVRSVVFSPDGKTIASASEDNTAILWDLDRVIDLNKVLAYGCNWVRDYLRTNAEVEENASATPPSGKPKLRLHDSEDRHLCDAICTFAN